MRRRFIFLNFFFKFTGLMVNLSNRETTISKPGRELRGVVNTHETITSFLISN